MWDDFIQYYYGNRVKKGLKKYSAIYQREKNKVIEDLLSRSDTMNRRLKVLARNKIIVTFDNFLSL